MTHPRAGTDIDDVLGQMKDEVVALFGNTFAADAIRVDVDVFDGGEPLVAGKPLDSMDLVHVVAAFEERFDVPLAAVLTGDEPLTLTAVAGHIVRSRS